MKQRKARQILIGVALVLGGVFGPTGGLQAQLVCTGTACSALPFSTTVLDNMFQSIQTQYLNEIVKDMSTASALAAANISPTGVVNLREFTVGGALAGAATKQRKVDVNVPDYGVIKEMPIMGVAAVPRAFVGFNVGYLFSGEPQNWDDLGFLSPYRFDIYVSGLNGSLSDLKDMVKTKANVNWDASTRFYGGEVRYHLIEGGDRGSFLFAFTGMSLGVGYSHVIEHLSYTETNSKLKINAGSGVNVIWDAQNKITYDSRADVYPVTLRTGVQLLYLLRLSVGGGVAFTKGSSELNMDRNGRAYLDTNIPAVLGTTLPDAWMNLHLKGTGGPGEARIPIATAGLELNIPFIKIFADVQGNRKEQTASVGARMVF